MSFMEKVATIMKRPGEDVVPKDDVPWYLKYGARVCGAAGGGLAIIMGVFNMLTVHPGYIIVALLQITAGFCILIIEAPCCCLFIDYVQMIGEFVDKRPYWNRAVLYFAISIIPFVTYINVTSFIGMSLIFLTGVLYGMMSLGKKGTREDMATMASPTGVTATQPNAMDHSSTLMEDPDVWRPT